MVLFFRLANLCSAQRHFSARVCLPSFGPHRHELLDSTSWRVHDLDRGTTFTVLLRITFAYFPYGLLGLGRTDRTQFFSHNLLLIRRHSGVGSFILLLLLLIFILLSASVIGSAQFDSLVNASRVVERKLGLDPVRSANNGVLIVLWIGWLSLVFR